MKNHPFCLPLSLSLLFFYVSLVQLTSAAEVFDSCEYSWDCDGDAICYSINNDGSGGWCFGGANCFCLKEDTCTDSNNCQVGEACVKLFPTALSYYCIPCDAFSKTRFDPSQVDTVPVCPAGTSDSNGGFPSPVPTPSTGAVFDSCEYSWDCNGGTTCYSINNDGSGGWCFGGANCFCLKEDTCTDSNNCQVGEACAKLFPTATYYYCVPCAAFSSTLFTPVQVDDLSVCSTDTASNSTPSPAISSVTISPESSAEPTPAGGSSEITVSPSTTPSQASTDTASTTTPSPAVSSITVSPESSAEPTPAGGSSEITVLPSTTPSQATEGPTSAQTTRPTLNPTGTSGTSSTDTSPPDTGTPNPTTTPPFFSVCIAVDSLQSFASTDLIYKEHFRASVLCDKAGSCATPGHIVLNHGRPMMMKTYCAEFESGCERAVRFVNSPRMKQQMRIPSKSDHLLFTALSARFETRAEEMVIAGLVRAGL